MHNNCLIHHFLETSAAHYPNKVAVIHEDTRATYAQINSKANRLAHWLLDERVQGGDRIIVLLENSLEYVITYYASLKTGAAVVPLSINLKPDSLKPLLKELEPKIIISSSKSEKLLQASDLDQFHIHGLVLNNSKTPWYSTNHAVHQWEQLVQEGNSSNPNQSIKENSLASIIYTSGSTEKPKGAMLSHKNIVSNTNAICEYLHLKENDIQMVVLPFFYVMGKSLLNTHIAVGGTIVLNNKFAFPAAVLKEMVQERVTGFSGVPSMYAYLIHRSPLAKYRNKLQHLRYCTQAGGHMSHRIKEELRQILPHHTMIYIMYGATEASARLSYLEPEQFKNKMDSIGKAIPNVSLKVLDSEGKEVPVGKVGELVASGPNIMQGYWKDPEATARVLDTNGYHTGDVCYKDSEGFFFIKGRQDNLLKVNGHRINPQEVEDAILASGLVIEAVVLGIPDNLLGHTLIGAATPKNGSCTEADILRSCAQLLPKYKVPRSIKLLRALPKSSSGKIDRNECMRLISTKADSILNA